MKSESLLIIFYYRLELSLLVNPRYSIQLVPHWDSYLIEQKKSIINTVKAALRPAVSDQYTRQ